MELFKELLDPKYSIFYIYNESGFIWFKISQFYDDSEILDEIGIICGLAIYNHVTINLPFPLALFKVFNLIN